MKTILLVTASAFALAACQTTNPDIAPPISSKGYATANSSFDDATDTRTYRVQLQHSDQDNAGPYQLDHTFTVEPTGKLVHGYAEAVVTYNGVSVTMQWDDTHHRFEGTNDGVTILFDPMWTSSKEQLSLAWVNFWDDDPEVGDSWGFSLFGFNTDPADVAARAGTATFTGGGAISLQSVDDNFWTVAGGDATLNADFDAGTISGSIDLMDFGWGYGTVTVADTTMTLNSMPIKENTFKGSASVNLSDLGLYKLDKLDVAGQFYESGATSVGGTLSGTGVEAGSGDAVLINGAFAAEQ